MTQDGNETRAAPSARGRRGRRGLKPRQWWALGVLGFGGAAAAIIWAGHKDDTGGGFNTQGWAIGQHVGLDLTGASRGAASGGDPSGAAGQGQGSGERSERKEEGLSSITDGDKAAGGRRRRMVSYAPARTWPQQAASSAERGAGADPPGVGGGGSGSAQRGPRATSVAYQASEVPGRRAGPAIDTTLTLMPGLYGCTLATGISSERDGPFFCTNDAPIVSPAGVTLMEKGSTIVGNYRSQVGPGQSRILSLAAWGYTPQGVPVPLGAQASDPLGRTGIPGEVNTHFWPRMGSAVLLLASQGAISAAQAALQAGIQSGGRGNTYLNLPIGSSGIEGALAEAIRAGTAVQSTVEKSPGERIAFLVTEPISFADSYDLEVRR